MSHIALAHIHVDGAFLGVTEGVGLATVGGLSGTAPAHQIVPCLELQTEIGGEPIEIGIGIWSGIGIGIGMVCAAALSMGTPSFHEVSRAKLTR